MLGILDKKVVKSIEQHLESGYYGEDQKAKCEEVLAAIKLGKIRITRVADEDSIFDDLSCDMFNEEVNSDIAPIQLRKEASAFKRRMREQGVWTMWAEYWTGREWENLEGLNDNCIGGFVGHDFFGSGYELQIMEDALEAYGKQDLDENGFVIDPFLRAA
jgi:hypothetical protein